MFKDYGDREAWLTARKAGIGGSDAACVLGINSFKSNLQLWSEKSGKIGIDDISEKPAIKYGKEAEQYLRELFKLDFPEIKVDYHEFGIYSNDEYPFIFATLDGELTDNQGHRGILEIKTTTIRHPTQWKEWENRIPDSYYTQILHQFIATGWEFTILKAHIRYKKSDNIDGFRVTQRHYLIERKDVETDIDYLLKQELRFYEMIQNGKEPPLILPKI